MSGMLFKHTSAVARQAELHVLALGKAGQRAEPPPPDERDLEIGRLRGEVDALTARLSRLQAEWDGRLAAERAKAREEAAREHVRDEARRTDVLAKALGEAREAFERTLAGEIVPLAAKLAAQAFGRLVAVCEEEREWLGRVIARRVEALSAGTVTAIHVAPADVDIARNKLPEVHGARIVADPGQSPGTARIVLKLGEIEILPGEGAAEVLGALERAGADDA